MQPRFTKLSRIRYLFFFILIVFAALPSTFANNLLTKDTCPVYTFPLHAQHNRFKNELAQYAAVNNLPGAIIAVKPAADDLWVGAWGKAQTEGNIGMNICTPFRVGSITKVFVAVLALQLQEGGKLQLDHPIIQYLPLLKDSLPQASAITLRMLLNHSSGIIDPKNDDPVYHQHVKEDPARMDSMNVNERLHKYVYGKPLLFTPGTRSRYSNTGYWLVGKVIETVTQRSMQQLMEESIFKPAGMMHTYYDELPNERLAHGYFYMDNNLQNVTKWDKADGDGDPSSGIISTAADLVSFSNALFDGKLITPASMQQMLQVPKLKGCPRGGCEFGLGIETWNVGKTKGWGKNGSSIGYEANWIYIPGTKTTLVAFANKGGGSHKKFIDVLLRN